MQEEDISLGKQGKADNNEKMKVNGKEGKMLEWDCSYKRKFKAIEVYC